MEDLIHPRIIVIWLIIKENVELLELLWNYVELLCGIIHCRFQIGVLLFPESIMGMKLSEGKAENLEVVEAIHQWVLFSLYITIILIYAMSHNFRIYILKNVYFK